MRSVVLANRGEIAVQTINEELYQRFISYIDARPRTIETYTKALRQLLKYFSLKGITQPTREDILAYRDYLKEGHKPATVQNYITATRLFFQWLEQERLYPNVANKIKGARIEKGHKKDFLNSDQVKAVLGTVDTQSLQGLRDYAMIALMVTGGLRTIEVSRADIGDMREIAGQARLYIQGKGKEEKADYAVLQPEVKTAIDAYLARRGETDKDQPLFASTSNNSTGGRLSTRSVSGIVKAWLQRAGYDSDRLTAHSLRHTAITLALMAGKPMREVQQFARHTSPVITEVYAHDLERAKNGCEEAIARAIF
jgi:integrase/recombinase XerD